MKLVKPTRHPRHVSISDVQAAVSEGLMIGLLTLSSLLCDMNLNKLPFNNVLSFVCLYSFRHRQLMQTA